MKKSVSKKTKEVIEKHMGEMNHISSIMELTRTGARMMLQIAIEEELLAFLDRDYYERRTTQKGSRIWVVLLLRCSIPASLSMTI
ncbi:MAG: hypothetical protein L6246_06675 [Thermodesulfovibrionales bacterium]|nr:hypothetical protein [Thermodesulfovibrionales bacterium]